MKNKKEILSQSLIIITCLFILILSIYSILDNIPKDMDSFCEGKVGFVDTCDVIDYKWYQPHQCFEIDCNTSMIKRDILLGG